MKFTDLNLSDFIVKGLSSQGFDTATEIQTLAIPLIRGGSDIIGLSQTGSGKTYAYGIPALENINKEYNSVQFLVVCPTRELAAQISDDLRKLTGFNEKIKIAPIFGGSNMDRQIQALRKNAKVVVGTPGRLMDHLRRKTLKLENLKVLVLDEADEMLNMGFKEDIETILKTTPVTRQTVMFSATMPPEIQKLTKQYMKEPVMVKSKNHDSQHAMIKQYYINCDKAQKTSVLEKIYEKVNPWISIVFCNTKRMTEELADSLKKNGLPAVCLHGDMRQSERKRVMENFKKDGAGGILVATDVAARGIDIKNVDIVVNYDFPNNEDYFIHRVGRTGRAGKEGIAFTIINSKNQAKDLHNLIIKTGGKIEEYKSLSTTQWSTKESNQGESKRPLGNQRMQRSNTRQNNTRTSTDNRSGFRSSNDKRGHGENKRNSGDRREQNGVKNFANKRECGKKGDNRNRREQGGFISIDTSYEKIENKNHNEKRRINYNKFEGKGTPNRFEKTDNKKNDSNNFRKPSFGRTNRRGETSCFQK